jgi:hypothetical protein
MVDDECNDLFEEYKEDWEFEDSNAMDTPLRKAMRDAGMNKYNHLSFVIYLTNLHLLFYFQT